MDYSVSVGFSRIEIIFYVNLNSLLTHRDSVVVLDEVIVFKVKVT